jgi:hydrogenase-1 operon protein HyaF
MDTLASIGVTVEDGEAVTGNLLPLLHEIRHALRELRDSDRPTTIDLRAMPFAPGEQERLEALLGVGEVDARIEALGPSHVVETRIPGVWLVTHYNSSEQIMGEYIEITRMPTILLTDCAELAGAERAVENLIAGVDNEPAGPLPD